MCEAEWQFSQFITECHTKSHDQVIFAFNLSYKCGQKGHIKPQCPKLKDKQGVARVQFNDVNEDNQTEVQLTGVPNNTPEEVDPLLKEGEDLNKYSDENEDNQPKYNWDDQEYQTNLICFFHQ